MLYMNFSKFPKHESISRHDWRMILGPRDLSGEEGEQTRGHAVQRSKQKGVWLEGGRAGARLRGPSKPSDWPRVRSSWMPRETNSLAANLCSASVSPPLSQDSAVEKNLLWQIGCLHPDFSQTWGTDR